MNHTDASFLSCASGFLMNSASGNQKKIARRRVLHLAGVAAAATVTPRVVRAQVQTPGASRSARDRLEEALARIADPKGEGKRACLTIYSQAARAAADAADARAHAGITLGPLDGAIVTIKDLFDVAGKPTRAGSRVLADAPPASSDAPVVRRLRAAGSVIVAKSNMTEFAFSILGINPHLRDARQPGRPARASPAVHPRAARSLPPTECARSQPAPIPAARFARRQHFAA
jgi:aspartyl-tRNA(Asn)/glutamyl-tRNA(Gln) amidotransferase subunit A